MKKGYLDHQLLDSQEKITYLRTCVDLLIGAPRCPPLAVLGICLVYGYPPTDVEALGQNRSATVWWKPVQIEGKSKSSGDKEGGGRAAGAEETERGIGNDIAGGVLGEDRDFKKLTMVGYVVYRYRLDGREWHKKGGTNVDGVETASTRVKGLQNGLVYR